MKPSKNWIKMSKIYRYFVSDLERIDLSEKAALEAYLWESTGKGDFKISLFSNEISNGFVVGKHWMDATVKMWREDINNGLLTRIELYRELELKEFHWWLDRVL